MKRTIAITGSPRIELAIRELERMVATVTTTSASRYTEVVVNTTANHTMGTEDAVNVDTTLGAKTVYLDPSAVSGRKYTVSNRGTNILTVNGMGRNINDDTTLTISYQYSTAQLQFNGTKWSVI